MHTSLRSHLITMNQPTMPIIDCLGHEPADVYHAHAGEYLSSHLLSEFRRNPPLFRRRELGLLPEEGDKPHYLVGRATHTLILEGRETFDREYAIGGPINPKTGKSYGMNTKAFAEWMAMQNRPVITEDQLALIEAMALSVRQHQHATALLDQGMAEGVVRRPFLGVPCQIRIDWTNPRRGIVDLKTCDQLDYLEADARRVDYAHQLAFYRAVLAEATGVTVPVHLIAVEKREPYRVGVWALSDGVLQAADAVNRQAIERLQRCRASDVWPSGYEEVRSFDYL